MKNPMTRLKFVVVGR